MLLHRSARLGPGLVLAALVAALPPGRARADPDRPVPPVSQRAPELRLGEGTVTLPIVMIGEYPFVEGAISGVEGKLMLDTGYEGGFAESAIVAFDADCRVMKCNDGAASEG